MQANLLTFTRVYRRLDVFIWPHRRLTRLGAVPPRPIVKGVGDRHASVGPLAGGRRLPIGMIAPDKVAPTGRQLIERQRCAEAELRRDLGRRIAAAPGRFARRSLGRRGQICGFVGPVQGEAEARPAAGTWRGAKGDATHAGSSRRARAAVIRPVILPARLVEGALKGVAAAVGHGYPSRERVRPPRRAYREATIGRFRHWDRRPRRGSFPAPWPRRGVHRRGAAGHWATRQPLAWPLRRTRSPCRRVRRSAQWSTAWTRERPGFVRPRSPPRRGARQGRSARTPRRRSARPCLVRARFAPRCWRTAATGGRRPDGRNGR